MIRSVFLVALLVPATVRAQAWSPDAAPGRYRNPIIFADYSDPDVIRVGGDFWLVSSSFNAVPGIPVLQSRDLVHWRIAGHAVSRLPPAFDSVQHGNGVWAPSIRFHGGWYYVYWGDPDRGVYMVRTRDPHGEWSAPLLLHAARGWEDPCPFWDADGKAYLVHAFANSRAGVKSILHVARMSPDGTHLLDDGRLVFDGHATQPTIEGPKLYARDGWYYIFAPAGGVATGWQTVLRSRSIYGPYEERVVLRQGATPTNGPHQGAWVELANGDDWFVHFQDRGAYGRITHLEPMRWNDGWPVIGDDPDGDGTGQPVLEHAVPATAATDGWVPQTSDEFGGAPNLAWQWQANPRAVWSASPHGRLRLEAEPLAKGAANLWPSPNLLLQKFPAPEFVATTRVQLGPQSRQTAGLIVFGMDYAYVAVRRAEGGVEVVMARAIHADSGAAEEVVARAPIASDGAELRVSIDEGARCRFAWSTDGAHFAEIGEPFVARQGKWVGAKVGLFAMRGATARPAHADFDWFRITPPALER